MTNRRDTDNGRLYQASTHLEFVDVEFHGRQTFVSGSSRSRRSMILEWISTTPYTSHHKRISDGRLEGTCEWIFANSKYRAWSSSSVSKLLLLRGIPGAGKTYTASRVIDYFRSNPTPGGLAYFYCNRAEENRRDPESILSTLVQQLAQASEAELLKPVVDIYHDREEKGQISARLSITESQDLLVQLTDLYPQTTIFIDALDEIDHQIRIVFLKSLRHVMERSKNLVKIFATTRMDPDILLQFEKFPRIELQPDDNVADINRFVEKTVQNAIDDKQLLYGDVPDDLKRQICDTLRKRAKGMFQLATLQITFLCDMPTQHDVKSSMSALPDTLALAYDQIYERIQKQKGSAPQLALNAFRWIQCSYEPLNSRALLDASTVKLGDSGEFSHATITANVLLRACQNLLVLDEQLDVFRFAHLSVDEYLATQLPKVDSHTEIAKVCLSLLCTPNAWGGYGSALNARSRGYRKRHLLLYATVFWPWHISRCEDGKDCQQLTGLWVVFKSETNYQRWLRYHRKCVSVPIPNSDAFWERIHKWQQEDGDLLSSVCVFGLRGKFTNIPESKVHIEKTHIDRLLRLASNFGDLDIARLLIDRGADVSAVTCNGRTPLYLASMGGHEAVARLLIDWGANVSAGNRYETPLLLALEKGHEAVARLLIRRGADVSGANRYGETPLHLASEKGHEAVARLLIDWGADVSAANRYRETPLLPAPEKRHETVAWLSKYEKTPLHLASERGHEVMARLLIDRGADISAVAYNRRTPLHLASERGHEAVARLLIDQGADVSAANEYRETPLHLALEKGRNAVARLLIRRGADVSAANRYGETPLHLASEKGHEVVARLLIDWGADASAANRYGETPLHLASEKRHEAVARLLIDRGADVSAANRFGETPLHLASEEGHEVVARLLIDQGADVSAVANDRRTPLHLASEGGHEAVAQLLIDRGADVSAASLFRETPLQLALEKGHEAVARLLIDRGADVSAANAD